MAAWFPASRAAWKRMPPISSNIWGIQPEAKLILEAYCDVRGSVEYNQDLAERRAE